ncbi:MAG: (Fe-S)-binding protein [Chromatiales bacterium]|nr:(Fe-S)-binding protein [Chromatiales bacterium]
MTTRRFPEIPVLVPGAAAGHVSHRASADELVALGLPAERPADWHRRAIARLGELVDERPQLRYFLDACVKCGACTDKCHFFLGTGDPKNMPVARQDLLRRVYRRHFTLAGRLVPWLVGAADLDEALLDDWYTYFHQCTQCRRCAVFCPLGIDTAEIAMAARDVMAHIGIAQSYTAKVIATASATGNNIGLPEPVLREALVGLEEDVAEETGVAVRFPLDDHGADVLVVTPSADFFAEPHVDGLVGYAKVLHAAGVSWTLSSHASEAASFAMFVGDTARMSEMARRIRDAAADLGVRRIVVGECGHAWRVASQGLEALAGPLDFLDREAPVEHIVEVTHRLVTRGALRLDRSANDHRRVTYHDSCNVARASSMGGIPGGQFELPRAVIRAACNHFFDMAAHTIRESTYCCGGGAGLLADDLMALRLQGARPRLEAYRDVVERHGVTHLATLCAICKTQLQAVLPEDGHDREAVVSVHQLVGDAVVLGGRT